MSLSLSKVWADVALFFCKLSKNAPDVTGRPVATGLSVFIGYILYRSILWPFVFSPLRNIPGPPVENFILGHLRTVAANLGMAAPQREWVKQYGPVVRLVGPIGQEWLMVTKPEALHQLLVQDCAQYPRPDFFRKVYVLASEAGLFTATGDEHKHARKMMSRAFSTPALMAQADMYWESIDGLIDILNDKIDSEHQSRVLRLHEWMTRLAIDIICKTTLEYKTDSLHEPDNEVAAPYYTLACLQSGVRLVKICLAMPIPGVTRFLTSTRAYRLKSLLDYIGLPRDYNTFIKGLHDIRKISKQVLEDKLREATIESSGMEGKYSIMNILLHAKKVEQERGSGHNVMTDQAMIGHILTFLGAGHEGIANSLCWALWFLATDQASQRKLRQELTSVMEQNSHPDVRTLKVLEWLDCVVMESLRLMPPTPQIMRVAKEQGVLDGMVIPKGTLFYIPIRVVNTWTGTWGENAEEYCPERWLKLPDTYDRTYSMLSFIAGPHACIGRTLAINAMKATLAGLIFNFEFEPAYQDQKPNPVAGVSLVSSDGMPLRVTRVQRGD